MHNAYDPRLKDKKLTIPVILKKINPSKSSKTWWVFALARPTDLILVLLKCNEVIPLSSFKILPRTPPLYVHTCVSVCCLITTPIFSKIFAHYTLDVSYSTC